LIHGTTDWQIVKRNRNDRAIGVLAGCGGPARGHRLPGWYPLRPAHRSSKGPCLGDPRRPERTRGPVTGPGGRQNPRPPIPRLHGVDRAGRAALVVAGVGGWPRRRRADPGAVPRPCCWTLLSRSRTALQFRFTHGPIRRQGRTPARAAGGSGATCLRGGGRRARREPRRPRRKPGHTPAEPDLVEDDRRWLGRDQGRAPSRARHA